MSSFFKPYVADNLWKNCVHTGDPYINLVPIMYKEKGYCELLVSLSMLFVQLFVDTIECDCSNQFGVEPVRRQPSHMQYPPGLDESIM